jgi:hypothetical protein
MNTGRWRLHRPVWLLLILFLPLGACFNSYISREARQAFQNHARPFTVTVYPVNVVRGPEVVHDAELGRQIADFLRREGLADASVGLPAMEIPVKWGHDQAGMAKRSAESFAARVEEANIGTDYALLVEILCNPDETWVGGVHYYLADREGRLADGGLTNSHWAEFKEVRPCDRRGGFEVARLMLTGNWGPG